jgi:hypothetical protein
MEATPRQIVDYWSSHQNECGLSVDWAEAEFLCWRCAGRRVLQRCHIIPRSLEGTDAPSNLVLLCGQCHAEAPNVADPEFIWTWLRAHAAGFYGTYWYDRGFREYEFIFRSKPLNGIESSDVPESKIQAAICKYMPQTSTHWGQGKPNPATMAWLIRQVIQELVDNAESDRAG